MRRFTDVVSFFWLFCLNHLRMMLNKILIVVLLHVMVTLPPPVSYRVGVQGVKRATFFRVLLLLRARVVSFATYARPFAHAVRNGSVGIPCAVFLRDKVRTALLADPFHNDCKSYAVVVNGHVAVLLRVKTYRAVNPHCPASIVFEQQLVEIHVLFNKHEIFLAHLLTWEINVHSLA